RTPGALLLELAQLALTQRHQRELGPREHAPDQDEHQHERDVREQPVHQVAVARLSGPMPDTLADAPSRPTWPRPLVSGRSRTRRARCAPRGTPAPGTG